MSCIFVVLCFLLFLGKDGIQTAKTLFAVYKGGVIAESNICKWLALFGGGNFDLEDRERSSRPVVVADEKVETAD